MDNHPYRIVSRSFTSRLVTLVLSIIIITAFLSGSILYLQADKRLEQSYSRKLQAFSMYKKTILRESFYIYLVSGLVTLIGLGFFLIFYSHKIAGPLHRLRLESDKIAAGNFGTVVKFRADDHIHPLAESMTEFAKRYGELHSRLEALSEVMYNASLELDGVSHAGDGEKVIDIFKRLSSASDEFKGLLSGIKV